MEEAAQCGHGGIGALLRREGLYSSCLTKWREEYAAQAVREPGGGRDAVTAIAKELSQKVGITQACCVLLGIQ